MQRPLVSSAAGDLPSGFGADRLIKDRIHGDFHQVLQRRQAFARAELLHRFIEQRPRTNELGRSVDPVGPQALSSSRIVTPFCSIYPSRAFTDESEYHSVSSGRANSDESSRANRCLSRISLPGRPVRLDVGELDHKDLRFIWGLDHGDRRLVLRCCCEKRLAGVLELGDILALKRNRRDCVGLFRHAGREGRCR